MRYLILLFLASPAFADAPKIEAVRFTGSSVHVTLLHPDTGWDHYADEWQIFDAAGALLTTRVLAHPHVNEQPFTRSTTLSLPAGTKQFKVVASCTLDDKSETFIYEIEQPSDG